MRLRILSSGSRGNSALIRTDCQRVLVDAGLGIRAMDRLLEHVRVPVRGLDHVLVTHGHLDHARSAGSLARRHGALLHAAPGTLEHPALRRARRRADLSPARETRCEAEGRSEEPLLVQPVLLPHDCDPTFALSLDHMGRRLVVLTDMGRPEPDVAERLCDPHVLVLESNHDPDWVASGPYPQPLKRRILGDRGHLSNAQAMEMLERMAGPRLHTLVLAHLSETNNSPERAREHACETLARLGREDVRVLVAGPEAPGPEIVV